MDEEDEARRVTVMNYQVARVAQEVYNLGRLVAAKLNVRGGPIPPPKPLDDFLVKFDDRPAEPAKRIEDMTPEEIQAKKVECAKRSRAVWRYAIAAAKNGGG